MDTNVITVRGLGKKYGRTVAVDGVDLDIRHGEIFALLGPNGAGKTTLVEILEGHRTRDEGDVEVLGVDPARADAHWRARIGIVSQELGGFPSVTVEYMVHHFASYYPRRRDSDLLLEQVGLAGKRRARAHQLSGGQQRRLDVALGIVGSPEVLFLDEPTTGFAPEARREFWDLIKQLSAEGTSILLTTHYLEEAEHLADRIGLLFNGRLVDVGTPATVGGSDSDLAQVRWRSPDGSHVVETATPTATVVELANRFGGEVPGLRVSRPTLEDVYLRLIGAEK